MAQKTYRVSGSRNYRGHDPGETFTENLSEDEERRATSRGSIEVVGHEAPAAPEETTEQASSGLFGQRKE